MTRRFLVVLGHSLHVRNFVASGCLDRLAARGHALKVLVPSGLIGEAQTAATAGVSETFEALEPYRERRLPAFLRRRARIASFVQRGRFKTYRYKTRLLTAKSAAHAMEIGLYRRLLAAGYDLESLARRADARAAVNPRALALVEGFRPDVVFAPTLIHEGAEIEVFKAARRRGVRLAAFAGTWDALTSKGFFLVPPDHLLVWGDVNRRHAIEFHGFAPEQVSATGAPHLDVYGPEWPAEPRERFLAQRGLDPAKRVVLFAGTTISYWKDEPHQLRALSEAVRTGELKDCLVWYRPHPRRAYRDVQAIGELPGVYVDDQVLRQKREGASSYSTRPEDLAHSRGLMEACDGVLAAFSTMILEAAMLGKPSLVVAFGAHDPEHGGLFQHSEYEHSLELLATPGITLCQSLDELKQGIHRIFSGEFKPLAETLRAHAARIARNFDGRGRERIVETLERVAEARA